MAALIIGWNLAVGVLFELGEQFRFRAVTDPITMSIASWIVWRIVVDVRHGRAALPESVAR